MLRAGYCLQYITNAVINFNRHAEISSIFATTSVDFDMRFIVNVVRDHFSVGYNPTRV